METRGSVSNIWFLSDIKEHAVEISVSPRV